MPLIVIWQNWGPFKNENNNYLTTYFIINLSSRT
jgi:hypothetical protein